MEGAFTSKGAVKMGAVKSFQGGNHINKKVPAMFAQSPLPLESFFHIQTWHTKYPSSGQAYALEFNVSFADVSGIAFNVSTLCQHRRNTNANWSQSIANTDLLQMYDKRRVVEDTLKAMGLDHTRLPVTRDPGYRHTMPTGEAAAVKAHSDRMRAPMAGEAPPRFTSNQPPVQSQQSSQSSGVPFQQPTASGPTRKTAEARDQQAQLESGTVYKTPPTPAHYEYRRAIPVSRQAVRDAYMAIEHSANGFSMGEWYVWYLSLEVGESLFSQKFSWVRFITADMLKNPLYQASATPPQASAIPE